MSIGDRGAGERLDAPSAEADLAASVAIIPEGLELLANLAAQNLVFADRIRDGQDARGTRDQANQLTNEAAFMIKTLGAALRFTDGKTTWSSFINERAKARREQTPQPGCDPSQP
jgi:hypothetical protein